MAIFSSSFLEADLLTLGEGTTGHLCASGRGNLTRFLIITPSLINIDIFIQFVMTSDIVLKFYDHNFDHHDNQVERERRIVTQLEEQALQLKVVLQNFIKTFSKLFPNKFFIIFLKLS